MHRGMIHEHTTQLLRFNSRLFNQEERSTKNVCLCLLEFTERNQQWIE